MGSGHRAAWAEGPKQGLGDTLVTVLEECMCVCVWAQPPSRLQEEHARAPVLRSLANNRHLISVCRITVAQEGGTRRQVEELLTSSLGVSVSPFAPATAVQGLSPMSTWPRGGKSVPPGGSPSCTFMNNGRYFPIFSQNPKYVSHHLTFKG